MYSMVGTEEWLPDHSSKIEFDQTIQDLLDNVCGWVDEEQLKIARKRAGDEWKYWCNEQIRDFIEQTKVPKKREKIIERIISILGSIKEDITKQELDLLVRKLYNDTEFMTLVK